MNVERIMEILETLGRKPKRVLTVVLPDPPIDVFVWIGTTWIAVYEN